MSIGGAGIGSGGVLEQQQNPAVARVGCLAHLGNAGLHVQTGPSVHSTQRSEHGGFCGPENSNKQRQKHRQGNNLKRRQPVPTPRAPCPAKAVRSMQTGARRIVQGSKVLIRHLHKSKRVSKLQLAARSSMRCVAVGNGVGRGTVLLLHEIDRADSTLRNATPLAVMQVPAVSSRGTSHACALWLVWQLSTISDR